MTKAEILPALLNIARNVTGEEDLIFSGETPFNTIPEWDSLNHVHMIVGMEDTFKIRFNDMTKLQAIIKIQDLLDIIAELMGI